MDSPPRRRSNVTLNLSLLVLATLLGVVLARGVLEDRARPPGADANSQPIMISTSAPTPADPVPAVTSPAAEAALAEAAEAATEPEVPPPPPPPEEDEAAAPKADAPDGPGELLAPPAT